MNAPYLLLLACLWTHQFVVNGFVAPPAVFSNEASVFFRIGSLSGVKRIRKRDRFLQQIGLRKVDQIATPLPVLNNITTLEQLNAHWDDTAGIFRNNDGKTDYQALLRAASVMGDTQVIGSANHKDYTHPVVKLIHERKRRRTSSELVDHTNATAAAAVNNNTEYDKCKVALSIEGGGMRGCVSAGMVCAIHHLNLTDSIDAVYGSSAGTIVGAYMITGQLPWFGPEVYYDRLTTAGRKFIDTRRLLRALGLGLLDPRLLRDVVTRRTAGKPVLNLQFLLKTTVQETKPLDWNKLVERQTIQPLNVIASGLKSEKAVVFNMANRGFETLDELTDCMHASCLLPGIAGPCMNVDKRVMSGEIKGGKKMVLGNNLNGEHFEPLADALLYEPLPYRTAIAQDGVTHCIVLRSRPDGVDVTGKGGIFEKLIAKRFFQRKNKLPHQYQRMKMHLHKKIYAEDVIRLNEEAYSERDPKDTSKPHLMAIAVPPGSPEVARLEVGRKAIFEGLRRGFARAYDCLVEDPAERGRGVEVAKRFFPEEILDYDPLDMDVSDESAFSAYMRLHEVSPKSWEKAETVYE
jgi:predicted acylesterase/phospholipase RssA